MAAAPRCPTPTHWEEESRTSLPQVRVQLPPPSEDDASTVGDYESDTSSIRSVPDKNALGWNMFRVRDQDTTTVYEAWEMISVRPTTELRNIAKILGVGFKASHTVLKDGYTGVRAVPSYSQAELATMATAAEQEYKASASKLLGIGKRSSYAQNLATRLFELPGCLPNKLGALLDSRFVATNKSQYARREWKIVLLQPLANVMTDEAPKQKRRSFFGRSDGKQKDPVQKWLLVLRGHWAKTSEEGFEAFDTFANPWLKVDQKIGREREEAKRKSMDRWESWS